MSGRRRSGQVELNFDGLNDSVTNLVGALILLVVLLIGVTREVVAPPKPGFVEPQPLPAEALRGSKSVDELFAQSEQLRVAVMQTKESIDRQQQRLAELREKAESLLEKAE